MARSQQRIGRNRRPPRQASLLNVALVLVPFVLSVALASASVNPARPRNLLASALADFKSRGDLNGNGNGGSSPKPAVSASSVNPGGRVARLHMLSKEQTRGRCLDGSMPGYYLREGYGTGANKWILFLEGGGWCFNPRQCANRAKTDLGSSVNWPSVSDVHFGGVASPDAGINPQFYNWNVVLVKYCDGSSFTGGSGKKNKTEETGKTLYYRGHWNLNGVLQDLLDTQNLNHGEEVLVGGCSAGAVAVSIKCDQIATWLKDYGIKTKCFMDGGFFPDVVDVNGERSLREKVQRLAALHDIDRIGINGDCKDAMEPSDSTWKCFFPEYNLKFVKSPMFVVNSLVDYKAVAIAMSPKAKGKANPLVRCLGSHLKKCTPQQISQLQYFSNNIKNSLDSVQKNRRAAGVPFDTFTFTESTHCVVGDELWQKLQDDVSGGSGGGVAGAASTGLSPTNKKPNLAGSFNSWYN
ncbi:unnamed protein product [Closterium sp. Yama58-4]|nr:unnamed protein product [Closterium sp. Yama58-4]